MNFQNTVWHYVDSDGEQKGPVGYRTIMRKLHQGEINGTTLVQSEMTGEWKPLSESPGLREAIQAKVFFDPEDNPEKEKA